MEDHIGQKRSQETRQRILGAAQQLFAEGGYAATGVAEICEAAGMSKGAFYHHFPTKQAVFLELLQTWLSELESHMALLEASEERVPEKMLRMAGVIQQAFSSGMGQLPLFMEFWTQASHDEQIWQASIAPYRHFRSLFAGLISQGVAEGSLKPVDPEAAASTLVSLGIGLLLQGLLDPQGEDWGQTAEKSIHILLEGLSV